MKRKSITNVLLISLFLVIACRDEKPEEAIAREFCQCFAEMTELYRQVQDRDGDPADDDLLNLMERLEEAATASEECVENVEMAYGDEVLEDKEEQIKAEMQNRCPQVIETLEEIDAGYE